MMHPPRIVVCCIALTALAGCNDGTATTDGGSDGSAPLCGTCFLHGNWQIDNLSPCFNVDVTETMVLDVVSSTLAGGQVQCPLDPAVKPSTPWSTDALAVDCPGHYRLCVTLKAGDSTSPQPSDCTMAQVCADGDYATAQVKQSWTALPAWITDDSAGVACAQKFYTGGGYGELSASGTATGCGAIARVLARVRYCPQSCNSDPNTAGCGACGGTGAF